MIDLHAHILPGLDDGPRNLDASVELARAAVAAGTTVMAATSHVDPVFSLAPAELARARAAVRRRLEEESVPLEVVAGGEIAAHRLPELDDDELRDLRLGGGPSVLLEAPLGPYSADEFAGLVADLHARDLQVLIAHPERAPLFQRDPGRLAALVADGARAQLTAGALLGEFGPPVRRFAVQLLREELVHVVASDGHGPHRPPGVRGAFAAIEGELPGAGRLARWMTDDVPAAILAGSPLPQRPALPQAPLSRAS